MKKGFSLVEIMVVLAALAGVALLVTKLGKSTANIHNESVVANDYNDLVRDAHFLLGDLKSCKVSLQGTFFPVSEAGASSDKIELWTSDSKGTNRNKKLIAKNEKFKNLMIENIILQIDGTETKNLADKDIINTTAKMKIVLGKTKSKIELQDIEHSLNLNFSYNATTKQGQIIDCSPEVTVKNQARVWCGTIINPCGNESVEVVAIGKYQEGKFTGTLQPTTDVAEKFCLATKNHAANFHECE